MKNLTKVRQAVTNLSRIDNYYIPSLWCGEPGKGPQRVDPRKFYTDHLDKLADQHPVDASPGRFVYNMFIRYAAAYDHNRDGNIAAGPLESGLRETGTFLKAMAMLPYIRSLGANTIYILPVTSIGIDSRKGNLGSPYAIRNPLELDENLAEPALGLDAETEFAAFAEAVHQAGMDLVAEFVFRTASLDSDLAIKHPEWFYWIDASVENRPPDSNDPDKYGPPVFDSETLEEIKDKVNNNDFGELPQPTKIYRELFRSAPEKAERKGDKIRGYRKNQELRIPGAFADWPPDDNQPVWSDVTYLKLYDHPDYNYIAYNTVRMYDEALAREKFRQRDLWTYIQSIVPDYIDRFDIDGVMVDMGHALPEKLRSGLIAKARDRKEGFLFWEENFVLDPKSVRDGYDAAIGYLPFDEHIPYKMKELIHRIASGNCPIDFFATAESHNTPRAASRPGGVAFSKMAWTINAFLPTIQFIHSGVELGEKRPVNTGLGFTDEQIRRHPSSELPLFSAAALDWDSPDEFTEYIKCINLIREKYIKDRPNSLENGICEVGVDHDKVVAFIRRTRGEMPDLLIVANMSQDKIEHARLDPGNDYSRVKMIDESNRYEMIDGGIAIDLEAWDAKIMEILA